MPRKPTFSQSGFLTIDCGPWEQYYITISKDPNYKPQTLIQTRDTRTHKTCVTEQFAKIHMLSSIESAIAPTSHESFVNIYTDDDEVVRVGYDACDGSNMRRNLGEAKTPLTLPFMMILEGDDTMLHKFCYELLRQWATVTTDTSREMLDHVIWFYNGAVVSGKEEDKLIRDVRKVLGMNVHFRPYMHLKLINNMDHCLMVLDHPLQKNDGTAAPLMVIRAKVEQEDFVYWEPSQEK
eukprot:gene13632-15055_t